MRFLDAGDCHLVVEFGSSIDRDVNRRVVALGDALRRAATPGIIELLPTYRSLLVRYDPVLLGREDVVRLAQAAVAAQAAAPETAPRLWRLPVAYGGESGPDLETVAKRNRLTQDEVIALHSGATYTVFMIGFAPGYAYLGGLPPALHTPRRATPRMLTPPGSISVGGMQAGVSSLALPSGWNLLGRTPVQTFDPAREPTCLLRSGDRVRFVPIDPSRFDAPWPIEPEPMPDP